MGFSFVSYIVMLLLLLGGNTGGFDALDAIPTDVYWQVKNVAPTLESLQLDAGPDQPAGDVVQRLKELQSDDFAVRDRAKKQLEAMGPAAIPGLKPAAAAGDPEVAAVAAGLIKRFSEQGKERDVRRLMAIRTLGERKEKAALPLLKGLVSSKEMFVSDYALRAVAAIEGNAMERVDQRPALAADVALLPKNMALVVQCGGGAVFAEPLTIEGMATMATEAMKGGGAGVPGLRGHVDRKQMTQSLTRFTLRVVERVGDFRIDGVTVGLTEDMGKGAGFVAVIVHGKYDAATVAETLRSLQGEKKQAEKVAAAGGIPALDVEDEMAMMFPSDERLVVVLVDKAEERNRGVAAMAAALKAGKGTLEQNAEITALLKGVDRDSPLWGVVKLTKEMQEGGGFLKGVQTATLESKVHDKAHGGGASYTIQASGSDAKAMTAAVDDVNADLKDAKQSVRQAAQQMTVYKGLLEFLEAIQVSAEGNKGTLSGEFKPALLKSLMGEVLPEMMMGLEESERHEQMPAATVPAQE